MSSVYGTDKIEILGLSSTAASMRVCFHGYRGLYHVSTVPPRAPVKIEVEGHPDIVTFVANYDVAGNGERFVMFPSEGVAGGPQHPPRHFGYSVVR